MIPELGKYAFAVLAAYGATGLILLALVLVSLRRDARARRQVAALEAARAAGHD